jgi:hypothetical protein
LRVLLPEGPVEAPGIEVKYVREWRRPAVD